MNKNEHLPEETILAQQLEIRGRLAQIEADWKTERAVSRRLTVLLITDYGYSVNKASTVSGHMRSTILTWLAADGFQVKG